MAICNFLFYCVVLFFSCYGNKPSVYGAREVAKHHHIVQMRSLVPASACSASNISSHGIQVYDRNGICSPLGHENSSPNLQEIFHRDQSRVNLINSRTSNKHSYSVDDLGETTLPISNYSIGGGNFVVTIGFGTPKKDFTLTLDTGSAYTWIQCKPCIHCYDQQDNIYDPKASSTFSNFPCTSECNYSAHYGDKSYSNGYYVRDTLTLSPKDVYPNFVFGCGQDNSKGFGKAAGMLGIGREDGLGRSFISQTDKKISKTFCYCLPATKSSTGFLLFGAEALKTCQSNKFTPLLKVPEGQLPYYFVNLTGITFGRQRLNISSYMYPSPNTILDSGTVITRLPPLVYSALSSAFQKSMSKYPRARPFELLDTCYNLTGHKMVSIPKMVLHFANADVNVDKSAVIWRPHRDDQVCLAFIGNKNTNELTIIGNHQQRKLNILYDIQSQKVKFGVGVGSCAY